MTKEKIKLQLIQGDCFKVLPTIPDESIDLVITSPPYNKGLYDKHKRPGRLNTWRIRKIKYGEFEDNLPEEVYQKQQIDLLNELCRVLKPKGSIFYNHKSRIVNHKIIFPSWVLNFNVRQIIIWDRGSSPQIAPIRFYPTTEYVFWITKSNIQPKFYRDLARHQSEVWRIPPEVSPEHPAVFPEELVKNCIMAASDIGDVVLDPFLGSGTTMKVARDLKRSCIGIEINQEYIELCKKRLNWGSSLSEKIEWEFKDMSDLIEP
jgi:site-specific DNA-methyltransferase (adenine-specific)